MHAAKLAAEGAEIQDILKEIERIKNRIKAAYILPNTRILYQRGFTDLVTAKICDMFRMHPILGKFNDKLTVVGVRLGKIEKVWPRFIRYHLRSSSRVDDRVIFVIHAGCSVRQQELILKEINRTMKFKHVIFTQASSASVCNSGLGSIGFAIYQK